MNSSTPGFTNPDTPIDERVDALIEVMTLSEKLAQLGSVWAFGLLNESGLDSAKAAKVLKDGLGHVTRIGGSTNLDPAETVRIGNEIQRYLIDETRLGIPAIFHEESLHGFVGAGAVVYPMAIAMASSWDPELVEEVQAAIGKHVKAVGGHHTLSPVLDISHDLRWGRIEETLGEDPYLASEIGGAMVRGLQSAGITATAKHFVGHGAPEGGRNRGPVHISPRELRDEYLYPFEVAVRRDGVRSVMHAYNDLDGIPAVANSWLFNDVLRGEWGFDGVVVSDYNGIEELLTSHAVVEDFGEAAERALKAGIDIELPETAAYGDPLRAVIEAGRVTEQDVDRAVRRQLTAKFAAGLFESPFTPEPAKSAIAVEQQRALAKRTASQSMILLVNDGTLPLVPPPTIAVSGPAAESFRNLLGGYSHQAHLESLIEQRDAHNPFGLSVPEQLVAAGSESVANANTMTFLGALAGALPDAEIRFAKGVELNDHNKDGIAEAVGHASISDLAIVVVGDRSGLTDDCTCGETRDMCDVGLPGEQETLIEAVKATGTPTVVVVISGRAPVLSDQAVSVNALLHAWGPGDQGAAAIVEVLLGSAEPGGRLPISVPLHVGQLPVHYRHRPSGGRSHFKGDYIDMSDQPRWRFGYGLAYTEFSIEDLQLETAEVPVDGHVRASVKVTNTGSRPGSEVVQFYARDMAASVTRPVKELVGFSRVHLEPGESAMVALTLPAGFLAFTNVDHQRVVEPGRHVLYAGHASNNLPAQQDFTLIGETRLVPDRTTEHPRVQVEI